MQRVWFISNNNSGTATREHCEALETVLQERQLVLVGRTLFPDDALPESEMLEADQVDTVVLFAGDGTINAALCRLSKWPGSFLILPGGTMNLLAKALHGGLDPTAIIHAAHAVEQRVSLPYVEAGPFRAFVGLIIGPGASWVRAREAARVRRYVRVLRGARLAWRRTFGEGVQIEGVRRLQRGYQAVFVSPETSALRVAAVAARDWGAITQLGWSFVTGDWMRARAVETATVQRLRISGRKPVMALFDGEPEMLDPDTQITSGLSRKVFLTTKEAT